MWLSIVTTVLGLIPGLSDLTAKLLASKFDKDVKLYAAKTGVAQEVAVAAIQAQATVQTKWWFAALIPPFMALPCGIYIWKVLVWDKVLALGSTDPILDPTVKWAFIAIVGGYFAHTVATSILGNKE